MIAEKTNFNQIISAKTLSEGYRSLVNIVFDIIYKTISLAPQSVSHNNIISTKGVVLIDGLEMCLHPQYQWRVIDALRKTFSKVQSIATTHSPILLVSSEDVCVISICNGEAKCRESLYGVDVNTALLNFMNTTEVAPKVSKYIDECYDAIDNGKLAEAIELINILEKETICNSPVFTRLKTYFDLEMIDLEN